MLGEHTYFVVHFYNQLSMVLDRVERLTPMERLEDSQIMQVAGGLLVAAEAAVRALPAFAGTPKSARDRAFSRAVGKRRLEFEALRRRRLESKQKGA